MSKYYTLFIIYINERRSISQPLLTNVKEYGVLDIAKVLPIGEQQVRRLSVNSALALLKTSFGIDEEEGKKILGIN